MFRYLGMRDGLHRVEDMDDGAIDMVNDEQLRQALVTFGEIAGLSFADDGSIVDEWGSVCVAAPVIVKNRNLSKAKKAKNDEFYTQLYDIEAELSKYPVEAFKDKVIYLPMDVAVDTGRIMQSQFVKYFQINAHKLQFKKLIATCLVERAAGADEDLSQVQNCYVLERVTVPMEQRNIWGYMHGYGRDGIAQNPVVGERDDFGIKYVKENGETHPVPYHIVNQAVTDSEGRITLIKKYIDHYDETDGHIVLSDEYNGRDWYFDGHKLSIKWCRQHPDGTVEILPDECYFFNNNDIISDFGVFPHDKDGNPCFESVPGGSVCLYPPEYYDFRESEYEEYSMHCPEDAGEYGGSGDFRSEYCKKLLSECDIVVTNPPFSLFRDFWDLLINSGKKFLIVANKNCVTYKEVFPLFKENKCWLGVRNMNSDFWLYVPGGQPYEKLIDGLPMKHIMAIWLTNLDHSKRHEPMTGLPKSEYERQGVVYARYDNYDAINVDKVNQIPVDYDGVMGVPITFLGKYCPEQFEIVGKINNGPPEPFDLAKPVINGSFVYKRIAIRRRVYI